MTSFAEASQIQPQGDQLVSFSAPEDWLQGRTLFGGVVAGAAVRAMQGRVEDARKLRSLLVSFVAPVRDQESTIKTTILREGRGISQVEAKVYQEGQICTVIQGTFGLAHDKYLSVPATPAPKVPAPEELPGMPFAQGVTPNFTQHIDYRWTVDSFPFSGADKAQCQGWVQYRERHPVDLPALIGLLDAWPPPILSRSPEFVTGSSVTWMVNLLQEWPTQGASPEEWWLYDAHCTAASDGYADTSATLWNRRGELVAFSRQLAVSFAK